MLNSLARHFLRRLLCPRLHHMLIQATAPAAAGSSIIQATAPAVADSSIIQATAPVATGSSRLIQATAPAATGSSIIQATAPAVAGSNRPRHMQQQTVASFRPRTLQQ